MKDNTLHIKKDGRIFQMSKYALYGLYGTPFITNDNTLKNFAICMYNRCLDLKYLNEQEKKDFIMESISDSLKDDISRTDINYEELLYKYRSEIGDILYNMNNNGIEMPKIHFSGKQTQEFFNILIYNYIYLNYDKFISGKV